MTPCGPGWEHHWNKTRKLSLVTFRQLLPSQPVPACTSLQDVMALYSSISSHACPVSCLLWTDDHSYNVHPLSDSSWHLMLLEWHKQLGSLKAVSLGNSTVRCGLSPLKRGLLEADFLGLLLFCCEHLSFLSRGINTRLHLEGKQGLSRHLATST